MNAHTHTHTLCLLVNFNIVLLRCYFYYDTLKGAVPELAEWEPDKALPCSGCKELFHMICSERDKRVSTNGVTAIHAFDRGTFWVLPLTYFKPTG